MQPSVKTSKFAVIAGTPKYEPPRSMWTSPGLDIAIKGQTKKMKCIFSG